METMSLSVEEILFLLVVLIANTIESMTGFAGTLLAMPASILLIGVDEARTVLNVLALICCSWITIKHYKHINKKELLKITSFMFIGMLIGMAVFEALSVHYLLRAYAFLIIVIALKNIFIKKRFPLPKIILTAIILLAGFIHGIFLSGGALLVIYAATALKDKSEFRATLAPVWVILDLVILFNQARLGHFNTETISLIALALMPLAAAIAIGNRIHEKINQKHFLLVTYVLLLISGSLIIK
jgi:uncharacterized membrane protein YfcA